MGHSGTSWENKDLHFRGKPLRRLGLPDGAEASSNFTPRLTWVVAWTLIGHLAFSSTANRKYSYFARPNEVKEITLVAQLGII